MGKIFNTGNCEEVKIGFELSNNKGFIPLFTRVFLDLQNGASPQAPIFTTPMHLTDASIPLTESFKHNKGLLYYETYLSYKSINNLAKKEIEKRAKELKFSYKIYDCKNKSEEYTEYDFGPYYIESKELLYFITLIDLV